MKMKNLLIAVLLVFMAGVVHAKGMEVTKKAGPNTVTITLRNDPPVTGENAFTVLVKDAAGRAVTDAQVTVVYEMPAMSGMPAMRYKAPAVLKGLLYTGTMNFSMAGSWHIDVKVARGGKTGTARLTVDVH